MGVIYCCLQSWHRGVPVEGTDDGLKERNDDVKWTFVCNFRLLSRLAFSVRPALLRRFWFIVDVSELVPRKRVILPPIVLGRGLRIFIHLKSHNLVDLRVLTAVM
jgi:hypothetical protein